MDGPLLTGRCSRWCQSGFPVAGSCATSTVPAPPVATVHDTTTCLVADKDGNVIAATPSGWSGVVAGDTGVWLGSRLQSFNTWEGHPNCIEPGKRPRITLTPGLVFKGGKPLLAVSVAGGDGLNLGGRRPSQSAPPPSAYVAFALPKR